MKHCDIIAAIVPFLFKSPMKYPLPLLGAAVAALSLAGCGGNYADQSNAGPRTAAMMKTESAPAQDDRDRIAAGYAFSAGLHTDGTVFAWGDNTYGQLGRGNFVSTTMTGQVSGLSAVHALAAGGYHAVALRNDGTVWGWGSNQYAQLGQGGISGASSMPVLVRGLSSVRVLAANYNQNVALRADGSVWGWGRQGAKLAQLPVAVRNAAGVKAIAAGQDFALAVKVDGSVWGWGQNASGQLGGLPSGVYNDATRLPGLTNVVSVAAGQFHALALRGDGSVWAWGSNQYGQLATSGAANVPNKVNGLPLPVGGASGVKQIAAGAYNSAVLYSDGSVWAWGSNQFGQLGNGGTTRATAPVRISSVANVAALAVSNGFVIFLNMDGTAFGVGANQAGQLGNNTRSNSTVPVQVMGLSGVTFLNLGSASAK
jgi:alpha-tubulin suppressor-like RCC1 family protein